MSGKSLREMTDEYTALRMEIKRRSMIYQVGTREAIAVFCGLPVWTFYETPIDAVSEAYRVLVDFRDDAALAFKLWEMSPHPGYCPEFGSLTVRVVLPVFWHDDIEVWWDGKRGRPCQGRVNEAWKNYLLRVGEFHRWVDRVLQIVEGGSVA